MSTELVERLREAEALNNKYAWERDKAREERDAAERRSEAHWRPRLEAAQAANTALTEALRGLDAPWVQFISCWNDPSGDAKYDAEEEKGNVKVLADAMLAARRALEGML